MEKEFARLISAAASCQILTGKNLFFIARELNKSIEETNKIIKKAKETASKG